MGCDCGNVDCGAVGGRILGSTLGFDGLDTAVPFAVLDPRLAFMTAGPGERDCDVLDGT